MFLMKVCIFTILLGVSYAKLDIPEEFLEISSVKQFAAKLQTVAKTNTKISNLCLAGLLQYATGLVTGQEWALRIFDAGTKLPSGILEGNLVDLGAFDECINAKATSNTLLQISGRYCLGTLTFNLPQQKSTNQSELGNVRTGGIPLSALAFQLAICMPDTCSAEDIQEMYSYLFIDMSVSEEKCQTKTENIELDEPAIVAISVFGVFLGIIIASTVYDLFLSYYRKQCKSPHPLLIAFSLLNNGKKLLSTSKAPGQISCMNGMRFISMMWIVLSHRFSITQIYPIRNRLIFLDWILDIDNMYIQGAQYAVDTFFLIGGIVLTYTFLNSMQKGIKFNIFMYYFHRYLRLTPALASIVLIQATLLIYMGSGPLWSSTIEPMLVSGCKENWWKALLYIQNYGNEINLCLPQSWYLTVDMQLFLLSPIILIPLWKKPLIGIILTGVLTVCSIIACFVTVWIYEFDGLNMILNGDVEDYMRLYYYATHVRAAPWLIGILFGYLIFKLQQRKRKIIINKVLVVILWASFLSLLLTCLYSNQGLAETYSRVANSFFLALIRPTWAVACGGIIVVCFLDYGGPVDWFLSLSVFQILSKLTYTTYLVHYGLIFMLTATMKTVPYFTNSENLYVFWGDFVFSIVGALIITLAFESPMITIEKFLFGGGGKPKETEKETSVDNEKQLPEIQVTNEKHTNEIYDIEKDAHTESPKY